MTTHLEILLEELSAERALRRLVPMIVPEVTFTLHTYRGKQDLLSKLPSRLAGYRPWLTADVAVVVMVDRDDDDCIALRRALDETAETAGLSVGSVAGRTSGQVLNRLAVEELEAWFFGDVPALCAAYPGVPPSLARRAPFRNPDDIRGGTWEALERVLKRAGHHRGGLRKTTAADDIAQHMAVDANTSVSFGKFRDGLRLLGSRETADA